MVDGKIYSSLIVLNITRKVWLHAEISLSAIINLGLNVVINLYDHTMLLFHPKIFYLHVFRFRHVGITSITQHIGTNISPCVQMSYLSSCNMRGAKRFWCIHIPVFITFPNLYTQIDKENVHNTQTLVYILIVLQLFAITQHLCRPFLSKKISSTATDWVWPTSVV